MGKKKKEKVRKKRHYNNRKGFRLCRPPLIKKRQNNNRKVFRQSRKTFNIFKMNYYFDLLQFAERKPTRPPAAASMEEKMSFKAVQTGSSIILSKASSLHMKSQNAIQGILVLKEGIIILCRPSLILYDRMGRLIQKLDKEEYIHPIVMGFSRVTENTFVTCGYDEIRLWAIEDYQIMKWDVLCNVDEPAVDIHFNGTYYCVLHRDAVTVLSSGGKMIREFPLPRAQMHPFSFGHSFKIYMDAEMHNIYITVSVQESVVCMSLEGHTIWIVSNRHISMPMGITKIKGILCVADDTATLHLISKDGQYIKELLTTDMYHMFIDYDNEEGKLYCASDIKARLDVYDVLESSTEETESF